MNIIDKFANLVVDFGYRNNVLLAIYRESGSYSYKKIIDVGGKIETVDYYGYKPKRDSDKFYIEVLSGDKKLAKNIKLALALKLKISEFVKRNKLNIPEEVPQYSHMGIGNGHLSDKIYATKK